MARPAKPEPQNNDHLLNEEEFQRAVDDSNTMAMIDRQLETNAQLIANQLGYQGQVITVGLLEDEIRMYQRRTAESLLELGKRLLILKELTPHGEFENRIELLGFSKTSAHRFMSAAFKFSKSSNLGLLAAKIDSQAKLLELVTMDDDDLQELANGETVLGLQLDDIDKMTARELKAALREARANEEAGGRIMQQKNDKIDTLEKQILQRESLSKTKSPDDIAQQLRHELMAFGFEAEHAIANKFIPATSALLEHAQMQGVDESGYIYGLLLQIEQCCAMVRQQFPMVDKQQLAFDLTQPLDTELPPSSTGDITADDLRNMQ